MLDHVKTKTARRITIVVSSLICALLLGIRIFVVPMLMQTHMSVGLYVDETIKQLFSMIVAALSLMFLIVFMYPWKLEEGGLRQTDPLQTLDLHEKALEESDFWFHHGHFGRWVRSKVFPCFLKLSHRKKRGHRVVLILLDPQDSKLCQQYASYRNKTRPRKKAENWTADEVRAEIYATIFQAYRYDFEDSLVTVEVYLSNNFSILRKDINTECVFQTSDDPRHPAIVYPLGSTHYDLAKTDFETALQLCKGPVNRLSKDPDLTGSDLSRIQSFYNALDLGFPKDDIEFAKLVCKAINSKSVPYEDSIRVVKY